MLYPWSLRAGDEGLESNSMTSCFGEILPNVDGVRCGGSEDPASRGRWMEYEGLLVGMGNDLL